MSFSTKDLPLLTRPPASPRKPRKAGGTDAPAHIEIPPNEMGVCAVTVYLPLKTESTLNKREHWRARAARAKSHRAAVARGFQQVPLPSLPVTVKVQRMSPRELDQHDNLPSALKSVIDGVADLYGIKDRDPRIGFEVGQMKFKGRAVRIHIARREATP